MNARNNNKNDAKLPVSNTCRLTWSYAKKEAGKAGDKSRVQNVGCVTNLLFSSLLITMAFIHIVSFIKVNVFVVKFLLLAFFFVSPSLVHTHTHTLDIEKSQVDEHLFHICIVVAFSLRYTKRECSTIVLLNALGSD